ncbi:hypothetical protein LMG7141_00830 [Ralstonia condita]|uniref:Uncharacterized protein n=1 Tax=Ralstonia condita TaxID=3058600 RepID=A0ABM9J159_9RALS|nr:hypothetical protein [Ralstonia sp. LMG 7141]CAJ0779025.1 hypothetical protein LMG7141_00830 [Ralstonia sp. LMG 7141]
MTKEDVYDEQIAPLMKQIIAVCRENKMAMVATIHCPSATDSTLCCSTALTTDEFDPPETFRRLVGLLRQDGMGSGRA